MAKKNAILNYNKQEINSAGEVLKNEDSSQENKIRALEILSNWRTFHSYPLHIFQMTLKKRSPKGSLVSQRLKRINSIVNKLRRNYNNNFIKLFDLQDIAGCRAVIPNIEKAEVLFKKYLNESNFKHELIKSNDYVTNPKPDGYRSYHLVYKFKSDKGKDRYNDFLVEIQIRSKLQHIWATAVETVDFFSRQTLKLGGGDENWKEFFRLTSSAFAIKENKTIVNGTTPNKKELYSKIKELAEQLEVIKTFSNWTSALRIADENKKNTKSQLFLLELDILREKLDIHYYKKGEEEKATREYSELEKKYYYGDNKKERGKDYDIVLVSVESLNNLKKAYPNYFLDTTDFIAELKEILKK